MSIDYLNKAGLTYYHSKVKNLLDAKADADDIPTTTSALTNDSNFVVSTDLATVATSGSYNDLLDKPNLATVATSGKYSDLTDTPTIPTVNDGTLTIQRNGTTVGTFSANSASAVTANINSSNVTMSSTDPGEGATLAAGDYIAVYGEASQVETDDIADSAVTSAKLASSAVETAKIANGAVTNAKTAQTTLWSGILQNYKTGSSNAITLSSSLANYSYVDFVVRLANWSDNDTNTTFRHTIGAMSYTEGTCNLSITYSFGGATTQIRTGTLRFNGTTLYWDANRAITTSFSGTTCNSYVPTADGDALSLIKVIGYK